MAVCGNPDPIGVLVEEHALQYELCDILESIADGLPNDFDKHLAGVALAILASSVPEHMRFEDEALFPLLRQRARGVQTILPVLDCLEEEHERDAATLGEVVYMLETAIAHGAIDRPDMLGYVLRGFFESQRRHIAWEDRVVVPLARTVLTGDDLSALQGWIIRSGRPRCSRQTLIRFMQASSADAVCNGCESVAKGNGTGGIRNES